MTTRVYAVALLAILLVGSAARLWLIHAVPARPISDFREYFVSAQSLATTGRYAVRGNPNGNHPPAYPLLLAGAFRLDPRGDDLGTARGVNVALALAAALAGATLARRLWGASAGLWTAAAISFFPRAILMADLVASENLYAPLSFLFLLLCAASWTGARRPGLAAAIGATVGLLALTRSVACLLSLVWLAGALAAGRAARSWLPELAVIVLVQAAVLLPWGIRNARALGRFTVTNTAGGVGLFVGNNPRATGGWQPWAEDLERLHPGIHEQGLAAVDDAAREEAWRWIRTHPLAAARLYARKIRWILEDDAIAATFAISAETPPVLPADHPARSFDGAVRPALRVSGILLAAMALGGWLLLVRGARSSLADRGLAAGFAAAALYVPLLSAAIAVSGRYRWPAEDAVMPLAGLFAARLFSGGIARVRPPAA